MIVAALLFEQPIDRRLATELGVVICFPTSRSTAALNSDTRGRWLAIRAVSEAERMSAVLAHVLGISLAAREITDPMGGKEANERMANLAGAARGLQETVAAVARVLDEAVARGDCRDAVAEKTAGVADFLREPLAARKLVGSGWEDEGMPATHAHVLVHAVSIRQTHVSVMPEEAGQRMADVGGRAGLLEVLGAASTSPRTPVEPPKLLVIDHVAPERATEAHPERDRWGEVVHAH